MGYDQANQQSRQEFVTLNSLFFFLSFLPPHFIILSFLSQRAAQVPSGSAKGMCLLSGDFQPTRNQPRGYSRPFGLDGNDSPQTISLAQLRALNRGKFPVWQSQGPQCPGGPLGPPEPIFREQGGGLPLVDSTRCFRDYKFLRLERWIFSLCADDAIRRIKQLAWSQLNGTGWVGAPRKRLEVGEYPIFSAFLQKA